MRETLPIRPGFEGAIWRYDDPARVFPQHWHDELEVNIVTAGTARYLVGSKRYDLASGAVVWLFPGEEHVLVEQTRDCRMWIGVFAPALLRRICVAPEHRVLRARRPEGEFAARLSGPVMNRLARLYAEIAAAVDDQARTNAGLAYALLLTWSAFRDADPLALDVALHPAVRKAVSLLRAEPAIVSLGEVARRSGLGESRLSRLFHHQIGMTMVDYRARQRLERFLTIYDGGERTMLAAALEAGFGSYAQFHRVFWRVLGHAPERLRRASAQSP